MVDMNTVPGQVYRLVVEFFDDESVKIQPMPQSGSQRYYFRGTLREHSVIAAYNDNVKENMAFIAYLRHFLKKKLPVPDLYAVSDDSKAYLLEDLGDTTLFSLIPEDGLQPGNDKLLGTYKKVLTDLVRFQTDGHQGLDYSVAYPRQNFDERAIRWDLNYFKYYFLHVSGVDYDENKLQNGFEALINLLLEVNSDYFMYRDFQARNILLKENQLRYIDFQGGRRGAPHYDVASLLYQSRADINPGVRNILLQHYLEELQKKCDFDPQQFKRELEYFKLIRMLQVLGAYGYRGYIQQRAHFLKSVPFALESLAEVLLGAKLPSELDALRDILKKMVEAKTDEQKKRSENLTVTLNSFSFLLDGPPEDHSGNGGGFVFDCRGLPNPGRFMEYSYMTGKDTPVIRFLEERNEVSRFVDNIERVVSQTIDNYIDRGFEHLMINFGCTGGQHRSVYCAEQLYKRLKQKYDVSFRIRHFQQDLNQIKGNE